MKFHALCTPFYLHVHVHDVECKARQYIRSRQHTVRHNTNNAGSFLDGTQTRNHKFSTNVSACRLTHGVSDKALVDPRDGSVGVLEAAASILIPGPVPEGGVQLYQVTLRREHEVGGVAIDHILCVK